MSELEHNSEEQLSSAEKRRYAIDKNIRELARRKEAKEVDDVDYDINYLAYLQKNDQPLTQKEIGNKALVISQQQFEQLGYLEIVLPNGEISVLDPETTGYDADDLLIIFPEELGNINK